MNKQKYAGSFTRHLITVIAGAILTSNTESLEELVQNLMLNLSKGDFNSIFGTSIMIFALIWSMWDKTETETKEKVVEKLSFKK